MTQRHSEYGRIDGDFFCSPAWITEALLSVESFAEPILVPGAGRGGISNVLAREHTVRAEDIANGYDFLTATSAYPSIITNPPWSGRAGDKFVRHALNLTQPCHGRVAMLLPYTWDAAHGRRDIFAEHPAFATKHGLTKRIRWENLEQISAPASNHAWYVWDWRHQGAPTLGWLP